MRLPEKLLRDLQDVKGFDEKAFMAAHQQPAVTSVRINPAKDTGLSGENEKVPWCANGVYLAERPVFTLDPAFHAGAYYVQEASSMFLEHLLKNILPGTKGLRVLDLCAAPGGKSTLLASMLDAGSLLISNEVIRTRVPVLDENMVRWGYSNTWVCGNDPKDFAALDGYFDVIVADAPCSGSGLFRKDKRAIDEWSEANVELCSQRQHRILGDVWPALKQDGILVYATCSYSPQEDEQVLDWLATEFAAEPIVVEIPAAWGIVTATSAKGMTGYRFFPDKVKGEGFFIAAVRKKDEAGQLRMPKLKAVNDKKIQQQAGYLLRDIPLSFIQANKDEYCAIHTEHEADWQLLQKALYLRKTGVRLGSPSVKEWLPAHDVALSIDASGKLPFIDVDTGQALRFLKREDMDIPSGDKGWHVIKHRGLGLGWVKSLGNRMNNYLPKHWRIRMEIN
jgi:16S rRNA C967 or C1407 C5-methylase (RsmB/RsmF family)/NOL1/NOP2/fmu family ribosome biogenesis protein